MKGRIEEKIKYIKKELNELNKIMPDSLVDYEEDLKTKAASERYAEKIIGALFDLAYLVIKYKDYESPETELEVFDILKNKNIISEELSEKLKNAKRMRNVIAHLYAEVNDEIVFNALKNELELDAYEFIKQIINLLRKIHNQL